MSIAAVTIAMKLEILRTQKNPPLKDAQFSRGMV